MMITKELILNRLLEIKTTLIAEENNKTVTSHFDSLIAETKIEGIQKEIDASMVRLNTASNVNEYVYGESKLINEAISPGMRDKKGVLVGEGQLISARKQLEETANNVLDEKDMKLKGDVTGRIKALTHIFIYINELHGEMARLLAKANL